MLIYAYICNNCISIPLQLRQQRLHCPNPSLRPVLVDLSACCLRAAHQFMVRPLLYIASEKLVIEMRFKIITWPKSLSPQHFKDPPLKIAQEWRCNHIVGKIMMDQLILRSRIITKKMKKPNKMFDNITYPIEMEDTPVFNPKTSTGASRFVCVLSPSCTEMHC
jgi:hypothetical protein